MRAFVVSRGHDDNLPVRGEAGRVPDGGSGLSGRHEELGGQEAARTKIEGADLAANVLDAGRGGAHIGTPGREEGGGPGEPRGLGAEGVAPEHCSGRGIEGVVGRVATSDHEDPVGDRPGRPEPHAPAGIGKHLRTVAHVGGPEQVPGDRVQGEVVGTGGDTAAHVHPAPGHDGPARGGVPVRAHVEGPGGSQAGHRGGRQGRFRTIAIGAGAIVPVHGPVAAIRRAAHRIGEGRSACRRAAAGHREGSEEDAIPGQTLCSLHVPSSPVTEGT